jgi:hypothetical protein
VRDFLLVLIHSKFNNHHPDDLTRLMATSGNRVLRNVSETGSAHAPRLMVRDSAHIAVRHEKGISIDYDGRLLGIACVWGVFNNCEHAQMRRFLQTGLLSWLP